MLYSLNSPCLMLNGFFSCPLFLALSSKDEQRSKLHTEYNCCCDIPCRKRGINLIHKVFLLPFIFSRATLSTQTYPAYLSDDLSCWVYFQVLDCDLTITCGFCMLEGPCAFPSMVRAASTPQCHIVWPGNTSWALLPTITSNPWLTGLFSACSWVESHHSSAALCKADDSGLRIRDLWWHNRFMTIWQILRKQEWQIYLIKRVFCVPVYSSCWDSHYVREPLSMALVSPTAIWCDSNQFI